MKLSFMLKLKAWQLFSISALLLFAPFFVFNLGINAVKFGLIIWFTYNQLYLSTIGFGLKHKIPSDLKISFSLFSFAIILDTLIFAVIIWSALGPNRITNNSLIILGGSIILGIIWIYIVLFALRVILIAENSKDIHYGDVIGDFLKIGFKFFSFFALQKRVQKLL